MSRTKKVKTFPAESRRVVEDGGKIHLFSSVSSLLNA
jgi:hypothetical protein